METDFSLLKQLAIGAFPALALFWLTLGIRHREHRRSQAQLAKGEIDNAIDHYRRSLIKIRHLLSKNRLGHKNDYLKCHYSDTGFIFLNDNHISYLPYKIIHSLLQTSLWMRNNKYHIDNVITVFMNHSSGDPQRDIKRDAVHQLVHRFDLTVEILEILSKSLGTYIENPVKRSEKVFSWPDKLYESESNFID